MPPLLHYFDDALWRGSVSVRRSRELTPLYVDRYRGPRQPGRLAAHPFWELSAIVAGSGELVAMETLPLKPHVVCLIPPRVPHGEIGDDALDTIWIGFRWRGRLRAPQAITSPALTRFIEQLWIFSKHQGGCIGPELDSMTATALAWFHRLWSEGAPSGGQGLVGRALRYFDQHFNEAVSIPHLAAQLRCSEGHLHRAFKQETGSPPIVYLTRLRIRHAARLLEHTERTVSEVAGLVGYENPFYFTRLFRRIMGVTPTAHREQAARRPLPTRCRR